MGVGSVHLMNFLGTFYSKGSNDATLYEARGMIYDQTGNHDGVINDFTEVIRIAPTDDAIFSVAVGIMVKARNIVPQVMKANSSNILIWRSKTRKTHYESPPLMRSIGKCWNI